MNEDRITIGITAYNAQDTIAAALDSALEQDVPVQQIIVVDDCSSDRTLEILEGYRARHPQIEVISHERNAGVAAARNTIIEHATGVFLTFFDDDDVSDPQRVRKQRSRILDYERDFSNGAPVICHTARQQIYPDGTERIEPAMGSLPGLAPHGDEVTRYTLMGEPLQRGGYGSCATCSQMARTETYRALGGFDDAFRRCGDTELVIRHARGGGHLIGLAEPLVKQRMTATAEKSLLKLRDFIMNIYSKHRDVFDSEYQYRFCRQWISLKFLYLGGGRAMVIMEFFLIATRYPVMTFRRAVRALGNFESNRVFSRFSLKIDKEVSKP